MTSEAESSSITAADSPIRFLILGMQRSGTTVTHVALRGHPNVAMSSEEVYVEPFFTRGLSVFTSGKSSYDKRLADYGRLFDLMAAPDRGPETQAIGFKVAIGDSRAAMDVVNCVQEYLRDVRIIVVHRSDLVAQYGSLRRAVKSGQWHLWEGMKASQGQSLQIPPDEFGDYAREAQAVLAQLRTLHATHDVVEFHYEQDIATGGNYTALFRFLDLPEVPMSWNTVAKVAPPAQDYILNYEELKTVQAQLTPPGEAEARAAAAERQREQSENETATFLGYRAWDRLKREAIAEACEDFVLAVGKRKKTPLDLSLQGYLCGLFSMLAGNQNRPSVTEALEILRAESEHLPAFRVCRAQIFLEQRDLHRAYQDALDAMTSSGPIEGAARDTAMEVLYHALGGLAEKPLLEKTQVALQPLYAGQAPCLVLEAVLKRWDGAAAEANEVLQRTLEADPGMRIAQRLLDEWSV